MAEASGRIKLINSDEAFEKELREAGDKLVVVDFFSEDCVYSEAMKNKYFQLSEQYHDAVFLKVDMQHCRDAVEKYSVYSSPTYLFIKERRVLRRVRGAGGERLEGAIMCQLRSGTTEVVAPDGQMDLSFLLESRGCECLNEDDDHPFKNALQPGPKYLESDCDEQLIITLAFKHPVKLHSLQLTGPNDGRAPKTVKLFINQLTCLGFDEVEQRQPVQELCLTEEDVKEDTILPLKFVRFQTVHSITIFVKDNQGEEDTTVINHIGLFGTPRDITKANLRDAPSPESEEDLDLDLDLESILKHFLIGMRGPIRMQLLEQKEEGSTSVIEKIAPHWHEFANAIEMDPQTCEQILATHSDDEQACCKAMFQQWLDGNARFSPVWHNLLATLLEINLEDVATQLDELLEKEMQDEAQVGGTNQDEAQVGGTDQDETQVGGTDQDEAQVGGTDQDEAQVGGTNQDETQVGGTDQDEAQVGGTDQDEAQVGGTDQDEAQVGGTNQDETQVGETDQDDPLHKVEQQPVVSLEQKISHDATTNSENIHTPCSHICATKSIHISGNYDFDWKGYGFKMHVPENALPAGEAGCVVDITVILPRIKEFDLPDNAIPVSAFYDISAPSGFGPVKVEIQHCACTKQDAALSFVISRDKDKMPFQYLEGGKFSERYGQISVTHFSIFGISFRKRKCDTKSSPRCYCAQLFYGIEKEQLKWLVHFTITCDLDVCKTTLEKHFATKNATPGPYQMVEFEDKIISLDFSREVDGWQLLELTHPGIKKEQVDGFRCDTHIPSCEIQVKWTKTERPERELQHRVNLEGAKPPFNFCTIICDPTVSSSTDVTHSREVHSTPLGADMPVQGTTTHATIASTVERPTMMEIISFQGRTNIPQEVGPKWQHFGIFLLNDCTGTKVHNIAKTHRDNPEQINQEIIEKWIQGQGKLPVTWETLVGVLHEVRLNELAHDIATVKCPDQVADTCVTSHIAKNPSVRSAQHSCSCCTII